LGPSKTKSNKIWAQASRKEPPAKFQRMSPMYTWWRVRSHLVVCEMKNNRYIDCVHALALTFRMMLFSSLIPRFSVMRWQFQLKRSYKCFSDTLKFPTFAICFITFPIYIRIHSPYLYGNFFMNVNYLIDI